MESRSRENRQLMRQRGASARNLPNIDFGLNMDTDRNRGMRQQIRQRGAGTRKIDTVDFGLSFPTPRHSNRSNSKTPQSKTPQSTTRTRRSLRNSVANARESSITRSQRSASIVSRQQTPQPDEFEILQANEQELRSSKRRRVEQNVITPATQVLLADTTTPRQRTASQRKSSAKHFPILEDPQTAEPETIIEKDKSHPDEALLTIEIQDGIDKENDLPGTGKPVKRRKRKLIGQQSLRRKKRSSTGSNRGSIAPTEDTRTSSTVSVEPEREGRSSSVNSLIPRERLQQPKESILSQTDRISMAPNRSRHSSVQSEIPVPPKRRQLVEPIPVNDEPIQSVEAEAFLEGQDSTLEEGISVSDDQDEPVSLLRKRTRRPGREPSSEQPEAENEEDEEYIDESEPPTPASQKQIKQRHARREKSSTQSDTGERSRSTKESFPILTHRLTNVGALPTIHEEGEDDSELEDEFHSVKISFVDRQAPNAVDVLAQICRETVSNAIEAMTATENSNKGRSELRKKRSSLEAFGNHLDGQLFDMSNAVENRMTLESRVRKAKKEKADLQTQWIEIRKKREQIALQCDEIRRQHWAGEREGKQRWKISEAAQRAELAMERNDAGNDEGLDYLLMNVASDVSKLHEGGGLLGRIKTFNHQLEQLVNVLEA